MLAVRGFRVGGIGRLDGSVSSAPFDRALFTAVLTGCNVMSDAGAGTSSLPSVSRSSFSGSSHAAQALGGSITGIRSWISAIFSLGSPVMIVQLRMSSPRPRRLVAFGLLRAPDLPEPGERERLTVGPLDEVRLLGLLARAPSSTRRSRRPG